MYVLKIYLTQKLNETFLRFGFCERHWPCIQIQCYQGPVVVLNKTDHF